MEEDIVVVTYKKNFGRFEKWLHSKIGGPPDIRCPLDEVGSEIWLLCDGKHSILEICRIMDEKHHENIEPVTKRIWGFLEILHGRGLITFGVFEDFKKESNRK